MELPRYTDEDIKKILKEFEGKKWLTVDECPEFKDVRVTSVYIGTKATFVRGHYRRVNGKRVYVRPHYRNKPNPARRKRKK